MEKKSQNIIWEDNNISKSLLIKCLILSLPGDFALFSGIILLNLGLIISALLFLLCPILYIAVPRSIFIISFTDDFLYIKHRYLGVMKTYPMRDIKKIEIIFLKHGYFYKSKAQTYFYSLKFKFTIFLKGKKKSHIFKKWFSARKKTGFGRTDPETKKSLKNQRLEYENQLFNLEKILNLDVKVQKTVNLDKPPSICCSICAIILLIILMFGIILKLL
ncbi:MAG: hypothetical protein ACP6IY_15920 [Promethearchaeia archaeon]